MVAVAKSQEFYSAQLGPDPFKITDERSGAFGDVFMLEETDGTRHALKRLRTKDEAALSQIRKEAELLVVIPPHRHVVPITRFLVERGIGYILMPYYPASLWDIAHCKNAAVDREQVAYEIALGVRHIHEVGKVLHLDLKPQNVLISEERKVGISDFGIAQILREENPIIALGAMAGTPAYMSPEVLTTGQVSVKSDSWSYAVLLFELWTGRLPFQGRNVREYGLKIITTQPRFSLRERLRIPSIVRHLLLACLEKNPKHRPHFADIVRECEGTAILRASRRTSKDAKVDIGREIDRANALADLGQHMGAKDILLSLLETAPYSIDVRLNLAQAYLYLNDPKLALEHGLLAYKLARGLYENHPSLPVIILNVCFYYFYFDPIKARDFAKRGMELFPDDWHIAHNYAEACRLSAIEDGPETETGRNYVIEGIAALRPLIEQHPDDIPCRETYAGLLKLNRDRSIYVPYVYELLNDPEIAKSSVAVRKFYIEILIENRELDLAEKQINHLRTYKEWAPLIPQFDRALVAAKVAIDNEKRTTTEWQKLKEQADAFFEQGKYEDGIVAAKEAIRVADERITGNDSYIAYSLHTLALMYSGRHEYAEAEPLFKRALAIREKQFGPDNAEVALVLTNLGGVYYMISNYVEAERLFTRALAIYQKELGPDHPDVAECLENIAKVYRETEREKEALELEKRAAVTRGIK